MRSASILSVFLLIFGATASAANIYTLDGSQGWAPWDVRNNGVVDITTDQPRTGNGSLKMSLTDSSDKAGAWQTDYVTGLGVLGDLAAGAMCFEWYRDSSSTAAGHLIPAYRVHLASPKTDGSGDYQTIQMIWEGVYNGYPSGSAVPNDQWVSENISGGNFWMWVDGVGGQFEFNKSLDDWYGFDGGGAFDPLGSETVVYGIGVGCGSGWGGYLGYVDNVMATFNCAGSDPVTYCANFEVPEPTTITLLALGGLALIRQRRS